jgi:transcriptional regulator with XRE-family HTH domain
MPLGRPSSRPRPPFGKRLYALRVAAGLTQAQVASQLGISGRAYAFWEREPIALKVEQVATLANILGVSADQLVGRPELEALGTHGAIMRQLCEAVGRAPLAVQRQILAQAEKMVAAHDSRKAS